jgi:hypothetical protein
MVILRDARLPENAQPPAKGSAYDGPEPEKMEGWMFATRRPTDQIGWMNDFYINERRNQEDYNYEVEYPYPDPSYPRLSRTYVYLRSDFADMPTPDLDEVDVLFPSLRLVGYEQVRFFIQRDLTASDDVIDPILDSLFIGIQKVYEVRPMQIIDHELSEVFGFGGEMEKSQTYDVPGQELEQGLIVVDSKTTKKGLNTEILETLKLAGEDEPYLELTAGGSGYTTPPVVSFSGDTPGLGGGAATASISVVTPSDPPQNITLHFDSHGDDQGVFYFIAKLENAGVWQNPSGNGITLTAIPALTVGDIAGLTDRAPSNLESSGVNAQIVIDIGEGRSLKCSSMDLRQRSDEDGGTTNLRFAGSNTGLAGSWTLLSLVNGNKKQNKWVRTSVSTDNYYRYFRLQTTDSVSRKLTAGEMELYGSLKFLAAGAGSGVVTSVAVVTPGNYLTQPTVTFVGGGGSGATARVVLNGNEIGAITVLEGGYGYTSPPSVVLSGGSGAQASATASLGFGIASIAVDTPGADYTSPPAVHIDGDGIGATAIALLGKALDSVQITDRGAGYDDPPVVSFSGGGGSGATGTAVLGFPVESTAVTAPGSGYTAEPTVAVTDEGDFGVGAAFRALRALPVDSIDVVTEGSGYTSPPTVAITGGDGTGATGTAVLGFGVDTLNVTAGGSGYTVPPTVVISGDGTGAAGTAVLTAGVVTSIVVTDPGSGYTTAPTVLLSGDGTGATADSTLLAAGTVISITLTAPGSDYTTPPDIALTGGAGSGATAIALLDTSATARAIGRILILNAGSGYSTSPTLTITGDGTGATATATLSTTLGGVISVTLDTPGSGYAFAPDVVFTPPSAGIGAEAISILGAGGGVGFITVIDAGSGYTEDPVVTLQGGGGTGATGTATLAATGSVVTLVLDVPGSYETAPTVIFTGGGGSGAAAIYHLAAAWATLYETETDPRDKVIIQMEKKIVPAGTMYPGIGFVDIKSLDKWRSIQITTKVDLQHLPPPETVPGSHRLDLPDYLMSVSAEFGSEQSWGWRVSTGFKSAQAEVSSHGALRIGRKAGFSGVAAARITRQFFFGIPSDEHIPCPAIIRPSIGNVILRTQSAKATATGGTPGGHSYVEVSEQVNEQVQILNINNVLTGDLHADQVFTSPVSFANQIINAGIGSATGQYLGGGRASSSVPSPNLLGIDTVWPPQVIANVSAQSTLTIDIPPSTPRTFTPGQSILIDVLVEKWRFDLYVLTLVYVIIPDENCVPIIPVGPTGLVPLAWWPMETMV